MRFQQVSRALVARVFRFLAFLVVEIDHQSGNFSKDLASPLERPLEVKN